PILGKETGNGQVIPKDYIFDNFLMLRNKNYICVTRFDKSTKENVLYMQEFDNSGRLTGELKKIASMSAEKKSKKGIFDEIISKDSTKFLLVDVPSFEKYN